jgi:hypothetical protein
MEGLHEIMTCKRSYLIILCICYYLFDYYWVYVYQFMIEVKEGGMDRSRTRRRHQPAQASGGQAGKLAKLTERATNNKQEIRV